MEFDTASLAVIGKDVFHLVGFGADGKIAFRRRIRRLVSKMRSSGCRRASSAWKLA
jgi:hypothetical protein